MDHDSREPTLPFRQDTVSSASAYSTRGNTLPLNSQYPARQPTYSSSVHSQPPSYHTGAGAAGSYYADAPSYTGQQHLGTPQHLAAQHPSQDASPLSTTSASPFDTPFDDSAATSRQNLAGRSASGDDMYGQNAIPLQDRNAKDAASEMEDHVYEAPKKREKRKQGVRFGELGMFGAYGNRIPWVVYIFSIAQVGVFIGQLVDNGKSYKSCSQPNPFLRKEVLIHSMQQ